MRQEQWKLFFVLWTALGLAFMGIYWLGPFGAEAVPSRTLSASISSEVLSFRGACDASAGVALSPDLFVVADDENNRLRLYKIGEASLPIAETDLTSFLEKDAEFPEADIEAATRVDQVIYWITSHGRNRDGKMRPNRYRFFATTIQTSAGEVRLEPMGTPCNGLVQALINAATPAHLGLDNNLKKKDRKKLAPKEQGLNIEGLSASADGRILYIGLRNPLFSEKAVVIPLNNARHVIERSAKPILGQPMLWDLGLRGIRSMEYSSYHKAFLVVAGPIDDESDFAVYRWSGKDKDNPSFARSLNVGLSHFTPEALIPFADKASVLLLSDDGAMKVKVAGPHECLDEDEYNADSRTCLQKCLVEQNKKTFRAVLFNL